MKNQNNPEPKEDEQNKTLYIIVNHNIIKTDISPISDSKIISSSEYTSALLKLNKIDCESKYYSFLKELWRIEKQEKSNGLTRLMINDENGLKDYEFQSGQEIFICGAYSDEIPEHLNMIQNYIDSLHKEGKLDKESITINRHDKAMVSYKDSLELEDTIKKHKQEAA